MADATPISSAPEKQHGRCRESYKRADRVEAMIERYYARVVLTAGQRQRIQQIIRAQLADLTVAAEREHSRCVAVLEELTQQERKLLERYYADKVSASLYDEEQARIQREREQTEAIAARLQLKFEDVERSLELALSLLSNAQAAYLAAEPHLRRMLNQAIFFRFELRDEDEIEGRLREPFATFHRRGVLRDGLGASLRERPAGWGQKRGRPQLGGTGAFGRWFD